MLALEQEGEQGPKDALHIEERGQGHQQAWAGGALDTDKAGTALLEASTSSGAGRLCESNPDLVLKW